MKLNDKDKTMQIYITSNWEIIQDIERRITPYFDHHESHLKDATLIVITELIENAVKYGASIPGKPGVEFSFGVSDNTIVIKVSNSVVSESNFKALKERIDEIRAAKDPIELYTRRLQELMDNPYREGVSQLGLYRIAYEGKFSIDYHYADGVVMITAMRPIQEIIKQ